MNITGGELNLHLFSKSTINQLHSGVNSFIVSVEQRRQDKIETKGGITIYLPQETEHEWLATTFGEVIATPRGMTSKPLDLTMAFGKPIPYSAIVPEVQIGDTAYFRYVITHRDDHSSNFHDQYWLGEVNGRQKCFRVPYEHCFAVIRNGEVIPIGGWVVLERVYDQEDFGVLINPYKERVNNVGIIKYIGTPLKGIGRLQDGVGVGTKVVYEKGKEEEYTINGIKYDIVYQHELFLAIE